MSAIATSTAPLPGRLGPRIVIASIVGLWLCYFVLATARGAVMGFPLDWPMLSRRIVVTLGSMAATALLWPVLHLLYRRSMRVKVAATLLAALPVSLLLAAINNWVFSDIQMFNADHDVKHRQIDIRRDQAGNVLVDIQDQPRPDPAAEETPGKQASSTRRTIIMIDAKQGRDDLVHQLTELALGRYFLLLAWAALYLALAYAEQARAAERREGEFRRAAKAAELRSLRYQINPHFLFNTLNSLSALVLSGRDQAAERMIQTLSTFYRRSLAEDPTADHTLSEEIELQALYLEIERVRFPDRLTMRFDIPDSLRTCLVPGMILQPLVENSVKYAVAPSRQPVEITIAAREERGMLVIAVADDGQGAADSQHGTGIGLSNVRERLVARFGEAAQVVSGPAGTGYRSELTLPLVRAHG